MKWEYDWLFTMQDPNDGGVYHKLTTLRFCSFIMPDKDDADRYMVEKSTAAALDFAAEMAMCARVFRDKDSAYADKALKAAGADVNTRARCEQASLKCSFSVPKNETKVQRGTITWKFK